jgi:hypothetical protein
MPTIPFSRKEGAAVSRDTRWSHAIETASLGDATRRWILGFKSVKTKKQWSLFQKYMQEFAYSC